MTQSPVAARLLAFNKLTPPPPPPSGLLILGGSGMYSGSGTLSVYDGALNRLTNPSQPTALVGNSCLSPDKTRVAILSTSSVYIYDCTDDGGFTLLHVIGALFSDNHSSVCWSPDSSKLLFVNFGTGAIKYFNTTTWAEITSPAAPTLSGAQCCDWSPDGTRIAIGGSGVVNFREYDPVTMTPVTAPSAFPPSGVSNVRYSPDNKYLATQHSDSSGIATIYKRSDMSKCLIVNPPLGNFPQYRRNALVWAPDSLRVVYMWGAGMSSYTNSNGTFTKEAAPASIPSGRCNGGQFISDGSRFFLVSFAGSPAVIDYNIPGWTRNTDIASMPDDGSVFAIETTI